jgi:1,2-diacylglycerol 3-alpha-glucosyltransferase
VGPESVKAKLRVGIVSVWCNRGQAVVSRYIRKIFADAGHDTFVLARPTNESGPIKNFVELADPIWNVPNVTCASTFDLPLDEYVAWAKSNRLDVVFCDMNLQFKEIAAVRNLGVRTIGRFVWERMRPERAPQMRKSYDIVYSLTKCEQARYRDEFDIDSPFVRLGTFPDAAAPAPKRTDAHWFIFHGGLEGPRKPIAATVEAFSRVKGDHVRLLVKSQAVRGDGDTADLGRDPRIVYHCEDMPHDAYHRFFSSCHVCVCPARWEGLGVHLYEALGYGMPMLTNDIPPINEVVVHGRSGLLVKSHEIGKRPGGVPIYDPDVDHLAECMQELADPRRVEQLAATTREEARRFDFANTRRDYLELAERAMAIRS